MKIKIKVEWNSLIKSIFREMSQSCCPPTYYEIIGEEVPAPAICEHGILKISVCTKCVQEQTCEKCFSIKVGVKYLKTKDKLNYICKACGYEWDKPTLDLEIRERLKKSIKFEETNGAINKDKCLWDIPG